MLSAADPTDPVFRLDVEMRVRIDWILIEVFDNRQYARVVVDAENSAVDGDSFRGFRQRVGRHPASTIQNLAHFPVQSARRERLLQERHPGFQHAMPDDGIVGVARQAEHL